MYVYIYIYMYIYIYIYVYTYVHIHPCHVNAWSLPYSVRNPTSASPILKYVAEILKSKVFV